MTRRLRREPLRANRTGKATGTHQARDPRPVKPHDHKDRWDTADHAELVRLIIEEERSVRDAALLLGRTESAARSYLDRAYGSSSVRYLRRVHRRGRR